MAIEFECEDCGRTLSVDDSAAGKQCQCPVCGLLLFVPEKDDVDDVYEVTEVIEDVYAVACPSCDERIAAPESVFGTKVQCKNCNYIFAIDDDGQAVVVNTAEYYFNCPKCNQLFEGKFEMDGKAGKCHVCSKVFRIKLRNKLGN